MKQLIKKLLVIGVFIAALALPVFSGDVVSANALDSACNANGASAICSSSSSNDVGNVIQIIVNVLLFIVGIISVVMIIIGGIRYATSAGNASSVTAAKNTVMYAIIGLIIAVVAFAVVNWVMKLFPGA